jgi:hypothetical protein
VQGIFSAPGRKLVEVTAAALLWLCVAPVCFGLLFEVLLVVPLQRLQVGMALTAATQAAQAAAAAGAEAIVGASCDAAASTTAAAAAAAAAHAAAGPIAGTGLFFSKGLFGESIMLLGGLQLAFVQDWVLGLVFLQLWAYGLIAGVFDGNHNGNHAGDGAERDRNWRLDANPTWKGRVVSAWEELQKAAVGNWAEVDSAMLLHW